MPGFTCFVCGLDFKSGKLIPLQTSDEKGRPVTVQVHEECRDQMIEGNHPENQNLGDAPPQMPGFMKPSEPGSNYPPVRPS